MGPTCHYSCPSKKRWREMQRGRERKMEALLQQQWLPEAERRKEVSPRTCRRRVAFHTLISDFWPPVAWKCKFLLCEASASAVLCYGSPRKLRQLPNIFLWSWPLCGIEALISIWTVSISVSNPPLLSSALSTRFSAPTKHHSKFYLFPFVPSIWWVAKPWWCYLENRCLGSSPAPHSRHY